MRKKSPNNGPMIRPNLNKTSSGTSPRLTVTSCGICRKSSTHPPNSVPKPLTDFSEKPCAAKKTPSCLTPVAYSYSSTMSTMMELKKVWMNVVLIVEITVKKM